jgi:hypothetical protein
MKKLLNSVRNLQLGKIMAVFILGIVVLATTACTNRGSQLSSRSIESPTQFNGQVKVAKGLIYSDSSDEIKSLKSKNDFVSPEQQKRLLDPTQVPAEKQPIFDRSDPDAKLLEKTAQMFEDAKATPDFTNNPRR